MDADIVRGNHISISVDDDVIRGATGYFKGQECLFINENIIIPSCLW